MSIEWFEETDFKSPIWVIKYDIYYEDGGFCDADTPGAEKFTACHGWYASEAEASRALSELGKNYSLEIVYKRNLCQR